MVGERGLPLLMRAADELLSAETEPAVLETATRLLGEAFGYDSRYIVLREGESERLRMARTEGSGSERPVAQLFETTIGRGLTGICAQTNAVVNATAPCEKLRMPEVS